MGPRRLRLILAAYLRGLLPAELPYGYASKVREELVLQALSIELSATALSKFLDVNVAFAATTSGNLAGAYNRIYDTVGTYRNLLELKVEDDAEISAVSSDTEKLVERYEIYKETGVMDALQKVHDQIDETIRR